MTRTRKEIWGLGEAWNDTVLWYARGVDALQKRPFTDRTSWRYLAAMHGFDEEIWRAFDYLPAGENGPPESDLLSRQCQHQTWYFLPWHRGYLAAFEAIVRDAVVKLGGPQDWAMPYWNYSDTKNPRARELPLAFAADKLPDRSPNPLKVSRRYGADGEGTVVIRDDDALLQQAMLEPGFPGDASGGTPGFGGPETPFSHYGWMFDPPNPSGVLEDFPHNLIHGAIGGFRRGGNPNAWQDNGLMSMPDTAALDPIFWIHHCNIDRLWEVWLRRDPLHKNTTERAWLDGPVDRIFQVPRPDGTLANYTARQMLKTEDIDYIYENVSDPLGGETRLAARFRNLGLAVPARAAGRTMEETMARAAELIGANAALVRLEGRSIVTQVTMSEAGATNLAASFSASRSLAAGAPPKEPDRVFLNLENIRGANDGVIFDVYVGVPAGADPKNHPDRRAGAVALFGVSKASRAQHGHGGNGLVKVMEITHVIDSLHAGQAVDLRNLNVQFVPRQELLPSDAISIDRVSVYRQGQ